MVALIAALQILLRSRVVTNLIDKYVSEYVDGELAYSDLDISLFKSFPGIRVTIDTLTLTYPHERFAAYDGQGPREARRDAGRGADNWRMFKAGDKPKKDTSASALPLISVGKLRIDQVSAVVYTDFRDTVFADLGFRDFEAGGDFKFSPDAIRISGAALPEKKKSS